MNVSTTDLDWLDRFLVSCVIVPPPDEIARAKAILRALAAETGRLPVEPPRPRYAPKEHP